MENPKILFLVNSQEQGPFGIRVKGLVRYFDNIEYKILYRGRKLFSMFKFLLYSLTYKSNFIYIINIAYSGIIAGLTAKILLGKKIIIDTGDINYKLFESIGRSPLVCLLERLLEYLSLRFSDVIITRSRFHKELLSKRFPARPIYQLPDGVDCELFIPKGVKTLKEKLGLSNFLTIGLIGSLIWNKKYNTCYGWDLIEAMKILKGEPLKAIIIGNGNGRRYLERKVKEYKINDRIIFTGRVAYENLSDYINTMDICLSTQTNDINGWVRVTGKLPLYLACARYILATDVGEAHYVLPQQMLLPFNGKKDLEYPKRLAKIIQQILSNRRLLEEAAGNRNIALENFDYRKLSKRLETILKDMQSG